MLTGMIEPTDNRATFQLYRFKQGLKKPGILGRQAIKKLIFQGIL